MKIVIFLFAAFALTQAFPKVPSVVPDGRIIGGDTVDIKDYPYHVSVQYRSKNLCGGTLVGKKWVVTAAFCTYGNKLKRFSVRAGTSNIYNGGQIVQVKTITEHPKFNKTTLDNDIAVLELSEEITTENATPIEMAESNAAVQTGAMATVTGWGTVNMHDIFKPSHELQMIQVPVVDHQACVEAFASTRKHVTDNMICAGFSEGGKDQCYGDNGGPLVVDGKLTGIISFAFETCATPNYPGVYTSIPVFREFIDSVINQQ